MITDWSGPFGSSFGQQPGVGVVELSLVESAVRPAIPEEHVAYRHT